jgi:hypothetical protein
MLLTFIGLLIFSVSYTKYHILCSGEFRAHALLNNIWRIKEHYQQSTNIFISHDSVTYCTGPLNYVRVCGPCITTFFLSGHLYLSGICMACS